MSTGSTSLENSNDDEFYNVKDEAMTLKKKHGDGMRSRDQPERLRDGGQGARHAEEACH